MWRVLIILGLMVATAGGAEARSLRLSFRPRIVIRPVQRRATDLPTRMEEKAPQQSVASVLDAEPVAQRAVAPAAPPAPAEAKATAHWCDNGKVVGTGAGFCVLNLSAGAPS